MEELYAMQGMTEQQRMIYMSQVSGARKDPTVGVLLALFLGGFGAHRFYMEQIGLGVLYIVFVWTFIPHIVALVECFFMPGRVRRFNYERSMLIASQVRAAFPSPSPPLVLRANV
jgi:TM2 domain-containing membrane protein YozV